MNKHYFNMKVNSLNRDWLKKLEWEVDKVLFKNSESIPEGDNIKIFQGIFSQKFGKWEKSRNWYKYDQNGWYVDNYARMPIILWQHDDSYGGIGFTQELWLDTKWNLQGLFYVDLDMLEERNRKQVEKWFVKMISTWAITIEDWFEHNETGKIYSFDEAEDEFGWENVWKSLWGVKDAILTYIVLKAELVENSLATIWSNFWAIAKSVNSLWDEMKEKAEQIKSKYDKTTLISKDEDMTKNLKKNSEEEVVETPETQEEEVVKTTDEVVETPETEWGEDITETKEENKVKTDSVETLKNALASKDSEIESLKNSLSAKDTEIKSLTDKIEKYESDAKEKILANANVDNSIDNGKSKNKVEEDKVHTMSDFTKKYSK